MKRSNGVSTAQSLPGLWSHEDAKNPKDLGAQCWPVPLQSSEAMKKIAAALTGLLLVVACAEPKTAPRKVAGPPSPATGPSVAPSPLPPASPVALEPIPAITTWPPQPSPGPSAAGPGSPSPSPSPGAQPGVGRPSNGTGGATGLTEVNFTDTNGVRSSYKINAPADAGPQKAYGLHIHLHGDGGGGYKDFPNKETRQNLIGVTVKAPSQSLQWGRQQGVAHANFLNDLIQNELAKKYNVDQDKIYFSGVSGGAYFLSGHFIPMFGRLYKSGAFLMCGGMRPAVAFESPEFLKSFRVHFQTTSGERQDITTSVRAAIAGFKAELDKLGGADGQQTSEFAGAGGHCEFDGRDYTSGIQQMMDQKFRIVVKP